MVVLEQQAELLAVVVAEEVGPGERGLVGAGAGDEAVAQSRVGTGHRVGVHAREGVAGAHVLGERLAADEALQCAAKVGDARVIDAAHLRERGVRVVES